MAEDDLWIADVSGKTAAHRLTSGQGAVSSPRFSPDGKWIAYELAQGQENPVNEVYVMPSSGGVSTRLTYYGLQSTGLAGWTPEGDVVVYTDAHKPVRRWTELYAVSTSGGEPKPLGYGRANGIAYGIKTVLGRNLDDLTYWKRYKGGTRGKLWVEDTPGVFKLFVDLDGNVNSPCWVGDRLYFVSDHEGTGNLYSVAADGSDLRRHTGHRDFYARNATSDGSKIVYHAGGEVYLFDPEKDGSEKLLFMVQVSGKQVLQRFIEPQSFLEEATLGPTSQELGVIMRGKLFLTGTWDGPAVMVNSSNHTPERIRLCRFLPNSSEVAYVSDASGEERIRIYNMATGEKRELDRDLGQIFEIQVAPKGRRLAVSNNRFELWVYDVDDGSFALIDSSVRGPIDDFDWSPDGKWLAYSFPETGSTSSIRLSTWDASLKSNVTSSNGVDYSPTFDPEGGYLYYLSSRHLDPVYDRVVFDLGFQRASKPFVVTLDSQLGSPFTDLPAIFAARGKGGSESEFHVDLEGIQNRCTPFPVEEQNYVRVASATKRRVFLLSYPVQGAMNTWFGTGERYDGLVEVFSFESKSKETYSSNVAWFWLNTPRTHALIKTKNRLRVVACGEKPNDAVQEPGKRSGWVDLGRVKLLVDPRTEWKQMFREAWRLMRENYWREDMKGVDWKKVYDRYSPLVEAVWTRSELSDLIREMQGEMGTSHAYEMGGDRGLAESPPVGSLGCELSWAGDGYEITRIYIGDPSNENEKSSLLAPGVSARVGDRIVSINGAKLTETYTPAMALWNHVGDTVTLELTREGKKWSAVVSTLKNQRYLVYRAWVESNRAYVHERSGGRLGYVHIPDMGPQGFAEFHRLYPIETERDGLIVDVRFNGGGHVSHLILEKLARKHIGYDKPRRGEPVQYPLYAVKGAIVAITNDEAGSDGDIFSHSFKLMGLGPLIGTRTWGGVVGINPRISLVDGTRVTQPQYAFYFKDVGWGVENYGTDPTIEVEITPQDYREGRDPQLDRAIEVALELLENANIIKPP